MFISLRNLLNSFLFKVGISVIFPASPRKRILPFVISVAFKIHFPRVVLPEPDSPTIPRTSPPFYRDGDIICSSNKADNFLEQTLLYGKIFTKFMNF